MTLKVAHIIPQLSQGGAEQLTLNIHHALNQKPNVQSKLFYFQPVADYGPPELLETQFLPAQVQLRLFSGLQGQVKELEAAIRDYAPQVLHCHLYESELVRACFKPGPWAHISTVHDNMRQLSPPSSFPKKPYWIQRASRTTLLRAFRQTRNHFLAISEDTQAYLKTVLPSAMHSRIALLKNAIPLHRFSHPQRAEWIPGSPLRLINVGSFVPKKNQKLAVLVLQELLNLGLDAQLILAGDGPLKAEVQEQVRTLGLSEKVFFLGNITDIELQYKEADLYLHTAWEEPFGLVLMEAMASGLSVVALDAGGNRELISDGRTGRLLPLNSTPAQVGTAIQDWMGSQKQQQEARQQAMAFAAGFGIESYVDQLLLHYNRIQPA